MSETDWAWAAGLFEGEGWISSGYNRKGNSVWPRRHLVLETTDFDVAQKFHQVVNCGKLHERPGKNSNCKPSLRWECIKWEEIFNVLNRFLPYFGERRKQAAEDLVSKPPALFSHCRRGHARTPDNVYRSGGCKKCAADNQRARRKKKKNGQLVNG